MKHVVAAPLALLVASCGDPGAHQTPEEALLLEAQEAVRAELKDPESARFTDEITTTVLPSIGAVCFGSVNSKNSFGGYTGAQHYFYRRGQGAVLQEQGMDAWRPIHEACLAELKRSAQPADRQASVK
jgi:hypothetical protein